jgi:hypothetical protein
MPQHVELYQPVQMVLLLYCQSYSCGLGDGE